MERLTPDEHVVTLRLYRAILQAVADDPNEDPALTLTALTNALCEFAEQAGVGPANLVYNVTERCGGTMTLVMPEGDA